MEGEGGGLNKGFTVFQCYHDTPMTSNPNSQCQSIKKCIRIMWMQIAQILINSTISVHINFDCIFKSSGLDILAVQFDFPGTKQPNLFIICAYLKDLSKYRRMWHHNTKEPNDTLSAVAIATISAPVFSAKKLNIPICNL